MSTQPRPDSKKLKQNERNKTQISSEHKSKLISNRVEIVENVKNIPRIVDHLLAKECISTEQGETILSEERGQDMARSLLDLLQRLSEGAFYVFLNVLVDTSPELYSLLKDEQMPTAPDDIPDLPTPGSARRFHDQLLAFHKQKLHKLHSQRGQGGHDLSCHISLSLYTKESDELKMRHGLRESFMTKTKRTTVDPADVFAKLKDEESPRSVLMLGAPGVGKTASCYFFLQEYTESRMWNSDFQFVIFILLRELNHVKIEISFQDLIFSCYGPPPKDLSEREQVWRYLDSHQEELLLILDGLDESSGLGMNGDDEEFKVPFHSTTDRTNPMVLLYNIIEGNIFPQARVLMSGRPHVAGCSLMKHAQRIVELLGLDFDGLQQMVNKVLHHKPSLIPDVLKYMEHHETIASVCSSPVNAKGLLMYIDRSHSSEEGGLNLENLPKSRAALIFVLIVNQLRNHDQDLKRKGISSNNVIKLRKVILGGLAELAYGGMFTKKGNQQLFDEDDIQRCNLSTEDVLASGLMSGHISSIADGIFGEAESTFLQFPHMTYQEFFAALRLSQLPVQDLRGIIQEQRGDKDMTLALCLGAMMDPMCNVILSTLYPHNPVELYKEKAETMLRDIWAAPRSLQDDGIIFSINVLNESGLYHMVDELTPKIVNVFGSVSLLDTNVSSADCSSVAQYLRHLANPICDLLLQGSMDAQGLNRIFNAGSYDGLLLSTELSPENIREIAHFVNDNVSVKRLFINNHTTDSNLHWNLLEVIQNSALHCLCFMDVHDTGLMEILHKLQSSLYNLQILQLFDCSLSPLTLPSLTNLKYLSLRECELVTPDMAVIETCVLSTGLVWLDIGQNKIGDEGAAMLANCLKHGQCSLQGLLVDRCEISTRGVEYISNGIQNNACLKVLSLAGNDIGPGASGVVTNLLCSVIEELYLANTNICNEEVGHLMDNLKTEQRLTFLSLGGSSLDSTSTVKQIGAALQINRSLLALVITNSPWEIIKAACRINVCTLLLPG